jgi:hypothetical protein
MKTFILKTDEKDYFVNDTKIIENIDDLRQVANQASIEILKLLSKKRATSGEIAKFLKLSQKKVLPLLKNLKKAGLISLQNIGKKGDVYQAASNSFAYETGDMKIRIPIRKLGIEDEGTAKFFRKFIKDGKFDGYVCVGSPDPHGEYKSIARDAHYAIYLSMFFGQFCELPKNFPVLLDTDVIARNLFKQNLIVVGGPVTNLVTRDINGYLPMKFEKTEGWALKDKNGVHGREYEGTIEKIKNPFDKSKDIIVLGGIRNIGTLSAILAASRFSKLTFRNYNEEPIWSALVRGYDIDGDGEIDSVETGE